jgi:hypothetical protein
MPKREYEIRASAPSELPLRDLIHCTRILRTGDAVDPDSAAVEVPRSEVLALASAGNLIVGSRCDQARPPRIRPPDRRKKWRVFRPKHLRTRLRRG